MLPAALGAAGPELAAAALDAAGALVAPAPQPAASNDRVASRAPAISRRRPVSVRTLTPPSVWAAGGGPLLDRAPAGSRRRPRPLRPRPTRCQMTDVWILRSPPPARPADSRRSPARSVSEPTRRGVAIEVRGGGRWRHHPGRCCERRPADPNLRRGSPRMAPGAGGFRGAVCRAGEVSRVGRDRREGHRPVGERQAGVERRRLVPPRARQIERRASPPGGRTSERGCRPAWRPALRARPGRSASAAGCRPRAGGRTPRARVRVPRSATRSPVASTGTRAHAKGAAAGRDHVRSCRHLTLRRLSARRTPVPLRVVSGLQSPYPPRVV